MDVRKAMALLVAVCMISTCLVFVGETDAASDGKQIYSNDMVTLDVTKDFKANQSELAKLGITSINGWKYDSEHECYVLTLDNVHFKTIANVGLLLTAGTDDVEPTVAIKLVGDNSIVSGSTNAILEDIWYDTIGIYAMHENASGEKVNDFNVIFVGDGKLTVSNKIDSSAIRSSNGIFVHGSMFVLENAVVIATAGDVNHHTKSNTEKLDYIARSNGIDVLDTLVVGSETGKAAVIATGGDINVVFDKALTTDEVTIFSKGVGASSFIIYNAYLSGTGGEIHWSYTITDTLPNIFSRSFGIVFLNIGIKNVTHISDSKVVGTANRVKTISNGDSFGIWLAASNGKIEIDNSIILGNGGDVERAVGTDDSLLYSEGIVFENDAEITNSLVRGESGQSVTGGTGAAYFGIRGYGNMKADGTILIGYGHGKSSGESVVCYGILFYKLGVKKEFAITDSEIYAAGDSRAIYADLYVNPGYRECKAFNQTTKEWEPLEPTQIDEQQAVRILYAYDVFITIDESVVDFKRTDSNVYYVAPYQGYMPEGMEFAGFYDDEMNEVPVGSTVTIDEYLVLYVTFEPAESPEGVSWIWITAVVILVIVAALAVLGVCLYKKH